MLLNWILSWAYRPAAVYLSCWNDDFQSDCVAKSCWSKCQQGRTHKLSQTAEQNIEIKSLQLLCLLIIPDQHPSLCIIRWILQKKIKIKTTENLWFVRLCQFLQNTWAGRSDVTPETELSRDSSCLFGVFFFLIECCSLLLSPCI